jgi:hypothetical protein
MPPIIEDFTLYSAPETPRILAKSETTAPQEGEQIELINLAEQVRYEKQSTVNSVIIIRWLSVLFCLAFWSGVYKLVNYVFLGG